MKNKFYTTNSIAELEKNKEDLITASSNTDTFLAWQDSCNLTFYDLTDKAKKYPKNINTVLEEYRQEFGHRLSATETDQLLQFYIDEKTDFKNSVESKKKLLVTAGPKYTKEYLEDERKPVEIRDELLRINSKDINLFQNFKLCGDQLVLIDGNDVELLTEDTFGRVTIDNRLFLKGNIAERVQSTFMTKISVYYKKLAEFLSTLDTEQMIIDLDNGIIETPIEDFIQNEIPTRFMSYYKIQAVYQSWEDKDKKKHKKLDHFELIRNTKIESFDEIFNYTLENWKKYKRCIQGQSEFLAWSNDSSKIAVTHWIPEQVDEIPKPWKEFLNEKMSQHLQTRLICFLGMCMDEQNTAQQYLIISDKGGTGKGVMMRAIEHALPERSISSIDENVLADTNEFGLAGISIWNTHISVMEEYKTNNLQSNKAKKFIANNPMDLNVKGKKFIHWNPINHKLIVFSNTGATIKDYANRRRAIPITFNGTYEWTQEKQDALNETAKDFLNFCFSQYKKCPLIINGSYFVLSEADEQAFLKKELVISDKDKLSKSAFSEECLKDYYKTDEYENTEDYIDYENLFNEILVEDEKSYVTAKSLSAEILNLVKDDNEKFNEYSDCLGMVMNHGEIVLNTKTKQWWKFIEYLKTKHSVSIKKKRLDNKVYHCYVGIKKKGVEDADVQFFM